MNPMTTLSLPQPVLDAADISAVTQLVLDERECRDRGRWERMHECYFPDSLVRISWFQGSGPEFVERSREMAQRGVPATHRLGPVAVRLRMNRAVASLGASIDVPASIDGVDLSLSSHARFLYRCERRDGRWGLRSFEAYYLGDELRASIPGQMVPITAADVAGFRHSYRMLSFILDHNGYAINPDLPGVDRPESVDALCREVYEWAGLEL
jgi:hypothetical protein